MSKLSANTLFHFTPREFLLDKFENGFAPRYNLEFDPQSDGAFFGKNGAIHYVNFNSNETKVEEPKHYPLYVPMVSFCDIPLSSLDFHMSVYSGYGIGLKKEWGDEKHLNPVMYVNEDSTFFNTVSGMLFTGDMMKLMFSSSIDSELSAMEEKGYKTEGIVGFLNWQKVQNLIMRNQIITHLKPRVCKGKYRGKHENYSYYDEKEWRYVPHNSQETPSVLDGEISQRRLKALNEKQKYNAINFTTDMVKYIIVENKNDIEFVVNGLNDIKRRRHIYTEEDIYKLTSKIIDRDQIREDY